MNFKCIELEGYLYQPKEMISLNDCWIIPACKKADGLLMNDCKLVLACGEKIKGEEEIITLFTFCYQYLFSVIDWPYRWLSIVQKKVSFNIDNSKISEVETQIRKKYLSQGGIVIDFSQIDESLTNLPGKIDFTSFYDNFVREFNKGNLFEDIISLFLHTLGYHDRLYDNILQRTHLQGHISEYRDKQITHLKTPPYFFRGTFFEKNGKTIFIKTNGFFPEMGKEAKSEALREGVKSESIPGLLNTINQYVEKVIETIRLNRKKSRFVLEE